MCGCGCREGSGGGRLGRGPQRAGPSDGCGCRSDCGCEPGVATTDERREAMEREKQRLEQQLKDINEALSGF